MDFKKIKLQDVQKFLRINGIVWKDNLDFEGNIVSIDRLKPFEVFGIVNTKQINNKQTLFLMIDSVDFYCCNYTFSKKLLNWEKVENISLKWNEYLLNAYGIEYANFLESEMLNRKAQVIQSNSLEELKNMSEYKKEIRDKKLNRIEKAFELIGAYKRQPSL